MRTENHSKEIFKMLETELKAPKSKTQVVSVDLFFYDDYLVDDYDTRDGVLRVSNEHNSKRQGSMYDVWYTYDDQGKFLRGGIDLNKVGVSP